MNIKSNKGFTLTELIIGFIFLVIGGLVLTCIGFALYALVHFVLKVW